MKSISKILKEAKLSNRPTNLHTEFQEYGVWLCEQLGDLKHYSLYIKLAKEVDRKLLDEALTFVKSYPKPKSKAKIYMWKLKQLKARIT